MYIPSSLNSITATSTVFWYLFTTLSGNQPISQWTTKTGVFSDSHCRNLCSSSLTCSQYFYTDRVGSVCLVSNDVNEVLSFTGPSIEEFNFARKYSYKNVTFATYNFTEMLIDSNLPNDSMFHSCYSIIDSIGVETFTSCVTPDPVQLNLKRAGDGTFCIDAENTFSCDLYSYASTSCLPGSHLAEIDGSKACRNCPYSESSLGGTSPCVAYDDLTSVDSSITVSDGVAIFDRAKKTVCGTGTDGVCAVCAIGFFPSSPTLPCPCPSGATCFLSSGGSALGLNYCNPGFYGNNVPYLSPCLPCGGLLWAPGGLPILLICNLCGKYATTCNHVNGWAKTCTLASHSSPDPSNGICSHCVRLRDGEIRCTPA